MRYLLLFIFLALAIIPFAIGFIVFIRYLKGRKLKQHIEIDEK